MAEQQGGREIPKPGDKFGCGHYGIMDLSAWTRNDLKYYVKKGFWLYQKPCLDCLHKPSTDQDRVLDVGDLLECDTARLTPVVMVCNCGPTAHKLG